VAVGMEDFHRNLPLKKLRKKVPVEWPLSKPSLGNFFHELGGGIGDLFMDPIRGAKEDGAPPHPTQTHLLSPPLSFSRAYILP